MYVVSSHYSNKETDVFRLPKLCFFDTTLWLPHWLIRYTHITFSCHVFMHTFNATLFVIPSPSLVFLSSSLCSLMTTWASWQQMDSLCWWLTLSTSWTALATPTFVSCTASGFSVRILPSWSRDSILHLKVVETLKADFVHKQLCSDIFNVMLCSISKSQVLAFLCFLTEKKPNYLKALSNIVEKLPKQVQVTELPAVSPQQTVHVHFYIYFITRTCLYPSKHQRY